MLLKKQKQKRDVSERERERIRNTEMLFNKAKAKSNKARYIPEGGGRHTLYTLYRHDIHCI